MRATRNPNRPRKLWENPFPGSISVETGWVEELRDFLSCGAGRTLRRRPQNKSVSSGQYAASRVSRKPNGHSRVKFFIPGKGIKPQPEAVEIMVADGAGGTPCGELSQRPQFGDAGLDRAAIVGGERNRPAHRHPAQGVFAKSECEPSLAGHFHGHDGFSGRDDFSRFGDQDTDEP